MKPTPTPWATLALVLGALCAPTVLAQKTSDTTSPAETTIASAVAITSLGDPWGTRYAGEVWRYARNIWDMRLHGGRLYVGGGNSSNKGPAANAGPVPIMAYDFQRMTWVTEGRVDDEQIDRFVLLDGELAIPGHDPRQNWQRGNLYLRSAQGHWRKQRRIPDGVHTYDVVSHAGRWFAALGTAKGGAIVESTNRGTDWQTTHKAPTRVYSLVQAGDSLFAFPGLRIRNHKVMDAVLQWHNGQWQALPESQYQRWIPDTTIQSQGVLKLLSVERFGTQAAYIVAYTRNDHQSAPLAAYVGGADNEGHWQAMRLNWPDGFVPWDVVVRDGHIHWLLNRVTPHGADVQIWRSPEQQPTKSRLSLSFSTPALARALEVKGDDYFVGLGVDKGDAPDSLGQALPVESGAVWSVRQQ